MNAPQVKATLQIKNQTHEVSVPVTVEARSEELEVSGVFEVKQSDLGITPFSVAMDALYVLDTVKVRFDLVAVRVQR